MSYSYQNPIVNNQSSNYLPNKNHIKKDNAIGLATTGLTLGALTGGVTGLVKYPKVYNKEGVLDKQFATDVFEKSLNGFNENIKEVYNDRKTLLKKIKNTNVEGLKSIIDESGELDTILQRNSTTKEKFVKGITKSNLKNNIENIMKYIQIENDLLEQCLKNEIGRCWDSEKKKFVKNSDVDENVFKTIKKSIRKMKWKNAGKFALIGGLVTGAVGFLTGKLISPK